ncbi:hypothetical protein JHK85_016375 [Glycine max]|nr:hypothetical protein JHK85_016375 [Glycine max]KAG5046595.1 hypothetical protein JHK86_016001 [Glycine max]
MESDEGEVRVLQDGEADQNTKKVKFRDSVDGDMLYGSNGNTSYKEKLLLPFGGIESSREQKGEHKGEKEEVYDLCPNTTISDEEMTMWSIGKILSWPMDDSGSLSPSAMVAPILSSRCINRMEGGHVEIDLMKKLVPSLRVWCEATIGIRGIAPNLFFMWQVWSSIYDKILNTKASLNDLGSRGNQILDKALELKESSLKDRGVGSGKGVVPTTKYWHKNLSHATRNKSYDDRSKDILQGKPSPSLGQVFSPHVSKVVKPTKEDLQERKRKGNEILHLMRIMEKK